MEEDQAWLLAIIERRSRGESWQGEIRRFLRVVRPMAERVVAQVQHGINVRRPLGADAADVIALADERFVMRGLDRYRADALPRTYYLHIVKNVSISFYRPLAIRLEVTEAAIATDKDPAPIWRHAEADLRMTEVERWALARDLSRGLAELYKCSAPLAEAVDLFLFEQRGSALECAVEMGITEANFNARVSRGRRVLQQIMIRMGYGAESEVN